MNRITIDEKNYIEYDEAGNGTIMGPVGHKLYFKLLRKCNYNYEEFLKLISKSGGTYVTKQNYLLFGIE